MCVGGSTCRVVDELDSFSFISPKQPGLTQHSSKRVPILIQEVKMTHSIDWLRHKSISNPTGILIFLIVRSTIRIFQHVFLLSSSGFSRNPTLKNIQKRENDHVRTGGWLCLKPFHPAIYTQIIMAFDCETAFVTALVLASQNLIDTPQYKINSVAFIASPSLYHHLSIQLHLS